MQTLEGLLKLPENRECADCKAKYVPGELNIDIVYRIKYFNIFSP